MTFSRRTLALTTVFLVVGVLGAGIWWRIGPVEGAEGDEAAGGDSAVEVESAQQQFSTEIPQPVEGGPVIRDTLWIRVSAAGRAEASRRTILQSQVDGVIRGIAVRENQPVGAGQGVIRIDTTELALTVAEARSELQDARADYERRILFNDEVEDPDVRARREEVARSRSGLNAAEVRLRRAELDLERATVRAPFGGRVANLHVVPGQHVTTGTELLSVVDLDPIKVQVQVLEAELGYLREGRRARVTFAAFPGESFEGRIETLNPVVDPELRTGRVTVVLGNPGGRIKPGMYAEVGIDAEAFADRTLVPRSALLDRGDGGRDRPMVFVYEEGEDGRGRAKWRYVTTGRMNEQYVEVLESGGTEGVEPGETVLVDGHHYLAHDVHVRLVDDVQAEGGRPGR